MVKIAIKSENITPYGGIFHVMDTFSKLGLGKLIESTLGQRENTGKAFLYSDILSSIFYSYLCGADCLEDINRLAPQFSMTPCMTRWGLKKLRTDDEIYTSKISGKEYKFNTAERLNQLLLKMINHLGLIKEGASVDLDFDHQFIPAHKYDAKYSYKGDYGYFPGWATVG